MQKLFGMQQKVNYTILIYQHEQTGQAMMTDSTLLHAPLVSKNAYINRYDPSLLFPIARSDNRTKIGIIGKLPFQGNDIWTAYELSWLNPHGKPIVAMAEFLIPCESSHIIESKSMKLYLNSFNQSKFSSFAEISEIMTADISKAINCKIKIKLFSTEDDSAFPLNNGQEFAWII